MSLTGIGVVIYILDILLPNGAMVGEDISDKPFTIEVVRVESPNGGETIKSGSTWTIMWKTNKTMQPVVTTELCYKTDGTDWKLIRTFTGNPGSYSVKVHYVTVPKRAGVAVRLKDASGNILGTDTSDNAFTIQP